jgi:hypothetical protein
MLEEKTSTTHVWQFVNTRGGESWCWRAISGNGEVRESSRLFKDFGVLMIDATRNGFRAQEHTWEIHKPSGTARYVTGGKVVHLPANERLLKSCCTGGCHGS